MNRQTFIRSLLWTSWIPVLCALVGWLTPEETLIPAATASPVWQQTAGVILGFASGTLIMLLTATVAASVGAPSRPKPAQARWSKSTISAHASARLIGKI